MRPSTDEILATELLKPQNSNINPIVKTVDSIADCEDNFKELAQLSAELLRGSIGIESTHTNTEPNDLTSALPL